MAGSRIEEPRYDIVDGDKSFEMRDLITTAGVGSNGELLVNTLAYHYPPELEAATGKRVNAELTRGLADEEKPPGKALAKFLEKAGISRIEDVRVRGGVDENGRNVNPGAAHVVYVVNNDDGHTQSKGTIPYADLLDGEFGGHVAQAESLAGSPAAAEHGRRVEAARSAAAAAPQGRAAATASAQNPVSYLAHAKASEILELMENSSPQEVEAIKAFEVAARGDNARKSIVEFEPDHPNGEGEGSEEPDPSA